MKKIEQILMLLAFLMAQAVFVSCSDDDDNGSTGSNNELVTIDKNGNASNGGVFSAIDDQNFYLDYIKYTVEKGHLVVTGYDESGFKGVAKIVARIAYNGNTYEVLEIGESAFDECSKLTSLIIPNTVTSIGNYAFCECEELTSLTIPNSVKSIGYYAFDSCNRLTSIIIPNSVTTIDGYAFAGCDELASITIGTGVTYIGEYMFMFCDRLTSIHCLSSTPPDAAINAFSDIYQTATLYVPKGSLAAYKSEYVWSMFENIVEE